MAPEAAALLQGTPSRRRRERRIEWTLRVAASISLLISVLIVLTLIREATVFLGSIELSQLVGDAWRPSQGQFDLRTIVVASTVIAGIAMLVAVPLGVGAAVYLSEYATSKVRRWVKPVLEVLAGVPSIVIGFFALTFITPEIVQRIFGSANLFNMLSAGLGVGILVTPLMASITEDALRSIPMSLREASYGLGARKRTTVIRVVLPAAISGIVAAFIISVSRAIGETMVVTLAAGGSGSAPFTMNPLDPSLTMTSAIANLAVGSDAPTVGDRFASLYFVGLLLFVSTLGLNILGDRIVRKYRKAY